MEGFERELEEAGETWEGDSRGAAIFVDADKALGGFSGGTWCRIEI